MTLDGLSFMPSFPSELPPTPARRQARTGGSHSPEVVRPAQHHAGPVAGALSQGPGQGGEQEDHGQVQHCHEEGEVEALGSPSTQWSASMTAYPYPAPQLLLAWLRVQGPLQCLRGPLTPRVCSGSLPSLPLS